ncbi:MAG: hypothetical protein WBP45_10715 [Daejeonella sp.]
MKGIKKSFGLALSVLLLLSFSVTILPFDLFHNHNPVAKVCQDKKANTACTHQVHIATKADYCWVCAIHFDKEFTKTSFTERLAELPPIAVLLENKVTGYFIEQLFSSLRAPPTE